ncbi:MAG TPA: hypothetical protein PLJ78_14295 [Anaerolineae bacterium]|nr:hypothetical protein [Anaerolineae bacterium]HQK15102.1 hypothetical protein [Anaerolineae bacterium]
MQRSNRIIAEFFAQGYRVSGTYVVTKRFLADEIYDPTTNYFLLEEAYLSPIIDPARISAYYTLVLFDKSTLDFVLTVDKKDGLRRDQLYGMGNYQVPIFLTVPFFEISGTLFVINKNFNPRLYLSTEAGIFITLVDVTVRSTFNPDISYQGAIALINRAHISFFGEKAG